MTSRLRVWLLVLFALWGCGREHMLPRPAPLPVHADGGLSSGEQTRLADVRRFLGPSDQQVLEDTLDHLAHDPRLPEAEVEAALKRSLSVFVTADGFCDRLADELDGLVLTGPPALAPENVALAVPTDTVWSEWLSDTGRDRYPDAKDLARAIRDGEIASDSFDPSASVCSGCRPLFVTDGAEFDQRGPSAAARLCLSGPAAPSYVVAILPTSELPGPLRVPTAADAVCRPRFTPAPEAAQAGTTCSGRPEYVTEPITVGAVREFRLSR